MSFLLVLKTKKDEKASEGFKLPNEEQYKELPRSEWSEVGISFVEKGGVVKVKLKDLLWLLTRELWDYYEKVKSFTYAVGAGYFGDAVQLLYDLSTQGTKVVIGDYVGLNTLESIYLLYEAETLPDELIVEKIYKEIS